MVRFQISFVDYNCQRAMSNCVSRVYFTL